MTITNSGQVPQTTRDRDGLTVIGRTRHALMGIRYNGGEGGNEPPAPPAPPAGESKPPWGDDPSKFDPDKAWKLIENLRTDIAGEKEKRDQAIADAVAKASADTQAATLAQFAKLLAGEQEPETDPVKLAATIAEKETALTEAQTAALDAQRVAQAAIHGAALGANVTALLADPAFKTSLASVDPSKEADIKSAITQALQENAALKQPPRQSGAGDHTGPTVQSLEAQLKAAEEKGDQGEIIRLTRAIVFARNAQKA